MATEKVTYENPRDIFGGTEHPLAGLQGQISGITLVASGSTATVCKIFDWTSMPYILSATAGGNFANQPASDGVEIVSNSGSDTQNSICYGTTVSVDTVSVETIANTGASVASTVKTNWGNMLGFELSSAAVGTITYREASGNQTIITITATNTSSGVATPTSTTACNNTYPEIFSSSTGTTPVGLVGTDRDGTTIYDSQALSGTANLAQQMNKKFKTVTKVLIGAVSSGENVTVTQGSKATLKAMAGTSQQFFFDPPLDMYHGCYVYIDQAGAEATIHVL